MQKTQFVIPLIRTARNDAMHWLGMREQTSDPWSIPLCEKLEDESVTELLRREISWRLDIGSSDFLVARMAQRHINPLGNDSHPGPDDEVELIFNSVDVYRDSVLQVIDARRDCRWLTASEWCSGSSDDGEPIDQRIQGWFKRWEIIQPWQ